MDMLAYFNIKKPDVVHETIDGETVIVKLGEWRVLQPAQLCGRRLEFD